MDTNDIKLIIESLHQAQETSERLILSQQISDRQIRLLTKRLKRFLELNANYIDFSIASIIEQPLKKNIQSTAISLKDVEINSQFFEIVNISIVSNKAKAITEIFSEG